MEIADITFDAADPRRLGEFWAAATDYSPEHTEERLVVLAPPREGLPKLLFLKVPEPKQAKNRCHVDLRAEDREADVERLVGLGATRGETRTEWGVTWTVLQDPEGNEFCVGG